MLLGARHDGRSMFGKLPLRPLLLFICNAGASEAQVLAAGGGWGGWHLEDLVKQGHDSSEIGRGLQGRRAVAAPSAKDSVRIWPSEAGCKIVILWSVVRNVV